MQKIINLVFIFLLISINSCAKDKNIQIQNFSKALKSKKQNVIQIDKSINNITIFLPKNIQEPFNTFIAESYKKLKQKVLNTIQNDCKETGWGYIEYNINYLNKELISIKKTEGYAACYGVDVAIPEYINLFFYNKKLYQVKLSNDVKNNTENVIWKDEDCRVDAKNKTMFRELLIKEGKPYTHIYLEMDKVCSQDIALELNENNLEFTLVTHLKIQPTSPNN